MGVASHAAQKTTGAGGGDVQRRSQGRRGRKLPGVWGWSRVGSAPTDGWAGWGGGQPGKLPDSPDILEAASQKSFFLQIHKIVRRRFIVTKARTPFLSATTSTAASTPDRPARPLG